MKQKCDIMTIKHKLKDAKGFADSMIDIPVIEQIMTNTVKENKSKVNEVLINSKEVIINYISSLMRKDINEEQPCSKCNHSADIHKGLNNRCLICGCRNYME